MTLTDQYKYYNLASFLSSLSILQLAVGSNTPQSSQCLLVCVLMDDLSPPSFLPGCNVCLDNFDLKAQFYMKTFGMILSINKNIFLPSIAFNLPSIELWILGGIIVSQNEILDIWRNNIL